MELNSKIQRLEKEVKDRRETRARIRIALSDVSRAINLYLYSDIITCILYLWSYHEIVIFFCISGMKYVILYCDEYPNASL